jgi:hypothetical protein
MSVALVLGIPDILLSGDQLDFLRYYDPLTGASLYAFRVCRLNYLTSQELT